MFRLQRVPLQVELSLIELQQFFNDFQWLHFKSILLALLVTPYKATLSGMVKVLSFGSHRSKHNEFLNDLEDFSDKYPGWFSDGTRMMVIQKKAEDTINLRQMEERFESIKQRLEKACVRVS